MGSLLTRRAAGPRLIVTLKKQNRKLLIFRHCVMSANGVVAALRESGCSLLLMSANSVVAAPGGRLTFPDINASNLAEKNSLSLDIFSRLADQ